MRILGNHFFLIQLIIFLLITLVSQESWAGAFLSNESGVGLVANNVVGSFTSLTKLITAGSYLAGMGFTIGAIMKFKQHKDNPTQIPIGTPIALVFIAAALLFLPSILGITGSTMFGAGGGATAGPQGTVFTSGSGS